MFLSKIRINEEVHSRDYEIRGLWVCKLTNICKILIEIKFLYNILLL